MKKKKTTEPLCGCTDDFIHIENYNDIANKKWFNSTETEPKMTGTDE